MRRIIFLAMATAALPMAGCCSLARLFCGPDESPWVSVDYQTPQLAVQTFLEALRRDDPEIVYLSMSEAFRNRLGVDSSTTQMAWPKIREMNPGLHVAGYAKVPEPTILGKDRARVPLEIEGHRVIVDLVRLCYWEVRYNRPGEHIPKEQRSARVGGPVTDDTLYLNITNTSEDPPRSAVEVLPFSVTHYGVEQIPLANVNFAGLERKWRIDGLTMVTE